MKNFKAISLATILFSLFLTSCDKDEVNSETPSEVPTLTGKWQFEKEGTISNNVETLVTYQHSPGCGKDFYEFKANNTGGTTFYELNCALDYDAFTFTNNGTTISITDAFETYGLQILSLTTTELKVKETGTNDIIVLKKI